jgi:hypothetical protein
MLMAGWAAPASANAGAKRTGQAVAENCRTLKFDDHGFEET